MRMMSVAVTVASTILFTIAAVLFIYMAAVRQDPWTLAAAAGASVAAVLGVIQLATRNKKQNA